MLVVDGFHELPAYKRTFMMVLATPSIVLTGMDLSDFWIFLYLRNGQSRLNLALSELPGSYFSDGGPHYSSGGYIIKIELADAPVLLIRDIVIDQLSIFEDSFNELLAIEKGAFTIRFINHPWAFVEGAVVPKHLPGAMS